MSRRHLALAKIPASLQYSEVKILEKEKDEIVSYYGFTQLLALSSFLFFLELPNLS